MGDLYKVSSTDRLLVLEKELVKDLNELKNEIDDNERVYGIPPKPVATVHLPKDVSHFRRERKLVLDRAMQVSEAHPITIQGDVMVEEMTSCKKMEYTPQSLPLLLHQFFINRMHQLVQSKHMHLLRWKRFCNNTNIAETMYAHYKQRVQLINAEYDDCLQRSRRLSAAREAYLAESDGGQMAVEIDDMIIYMRALVCHYHSIKRVTQFIGILQWFSVIHKMDVSCTSPESKILPTTDDRSTSSASQSVPERLRPQPISGPRRASSTGPVPAPPTVNFGQFDASILPHASSLHYAASAAGGGLAADEYSQSLPLNFMDLDSLRPQLYNLVHIYGIQSDLNSIRNSADEMELFAAVNKKFSIYFMRQETFNTFKTYDRIEVGAELWGSDHSSHALKREATWLQYVKLKPEKDPYYERHFALLRQNDNVDKLLLAFARFIHVKNAETVQETLRNHAAAVRSPSSVHSASVTSNRTQNSTMQIWKTIYAKPELYTEHNKASASYPEFDEKETDNVNLTRKSRATSSRKRRESYDYSTTVQMLGLDDQEEGQGDAAVNLQGAYLSYLHLRFLRIRDQKRTCLSVLNYFRSVERTLTINEAGLSQESHKLKGKSDQVEVRRTVSDPDNALGSHQYLHNTPADYKVAETEFIQFSEVENHDDYYSMDEGRVHVQDQRGYYIMYDAALRDLELLEHDMLLLATHYIEKDKDLRNTTRISRSPTSSKRSQSQQAGDFDIATYGHQEVDRYGVLMDLWTSESAFLEAKKNLLDCYYEAYQHVFDPDERRSIAQVITNIIHQRPRYDMDANYFIKVYRTECINLRIHSQLIKKIMEKQIVEERDYITMVTRESTELEYGLPYPIIRKQPISINMSSDHEETLPRPAIRNVYLLEFHPSLSTAARVPGALSYAYWQLYHIHKPSTVTEAIHLEKEMLELALDEWECMANIGESYSPQVKKDVFGDNYIEDPRYMANIAREILESESDSLKQMSHTAKRVEEINLVAQVLETVSVRSRLLEAAWQSEILSKVYRRQALQLGFEECHLFLRFVQFEFAVPKPDAGKAPPVFITAIQEDDTSIDKFVPSVLYLAVNELDESEVGKFNFRTKEGIMKFTAQSGLETLQVILQAQVVHKNALVCAVQLGSHAQKTHPADTSADTKPTEQKGSNGRHSPSDSKSERSTMTTTTAFSSTMGVPGMGSRRRQVLGTEQKLSESFVSLQLEKGPSRDLMLNEFIEERNKRGIALKSASEMEKLKRTLIGEYNHRLNNRMYQYSLRGQLTSIYDSILAVLDQFPTIRDQYFMLGGPNEKKTNMDSEQGLRPDHSSLRTRPRRLLTEDGRRVLNIWFIPHFTEILIMFKTFDDLDCNRSLKYCVQIVSALHDILHYLCAHAKSGSTKTRLGSDRHEQVTADWGGSEGIGVELFEIQNQINHLSDPCSPSQIADFLRLRRDVMFLKFEMSVQVSMCNAFLAMGNVHAYKTTTANKHHALARISNRVQPSYLSYLMTIPDPLHHTDHRAKELYPWRTFSGSYGMFPVAFWLWQQIEYYMRLCLAGLRDVEQHTAQGEILGVSLLVEDVIGANNAHAAIAVTDVNTDDDEQSDGESTATSRPSSRASRLSRTSSVPGMSDSMLKLIARRKPLSRTLDAVESYKVIKAFLILWKRLEYFKNDWGCKKLNVEEIDTVVAYKDFVFLYKTEKLFPLLRSIASRHGHPDFYDGLASDAEQLPAPPNVSEIEIRAAQLLKLCENCESDMILDIRKKLSKDLSLVLSERAREESALPTDLWKKTAIKENYTINRPHVYEKFHTKLMSDVKETEDGFLFPKSHLNSSLHSLAMNIMTRERHNYENYSMFYENLLRVHHQLLYQKEQEIKQVVDQLKMAHHDTMVDVQIQLADQSNDLLMEVTALRSKVAEMRQISLTQERDVRMRVKDEYDSLIRSLFSSSFELKSRFDEFRLELYIDVGNKIAEVRREAIDKMTLIKQKSGGALIEDELSLKQRAMNERIKAVKDENLLLNRMMAKMKTFTQWKQKNTEEHYLKQISEIREETESCKQEYLEVKMLAEEEVILLRQELFALRKYLKDMEKDSSIVKKQLEKEMKTKKDKIHAAQQKAHDQRQLEMARKANAERLLEELEEKDVRLKILEEDREKHFRLAIITEEKARKDVDSVRKKLAHERSLKLDAFQRVDELQHQVYDKTLQDSMAVVPVYRTRPKTTPVGSGKKPRVSSGIWPPPVQWPANRTPTPLQYSRTLDGKTIQRPKTVEGRLRSRVSDQLLSDLGTKNQLVHLQAIQL